MLEFLLNYALFFAKFATGAVLIVLAFMAILAIRQKFKGLQDQGLEVTNLNAEQRQRQIQVLSQTHVPKKVKAALKALHKQQDNHEQTVFVLDFKGDLRASKVDNLREEISIILDSAEKNDQVVLRLENAGGVVHDHGLAASQLARLRDHDIPLTVCVDKVAASGGYLMAAVANQIYAAPFALVGSIGALAQVPNFYEWLKQHGITFEQVQAGEHKRSLTLFGKNTEADRKKVQEDLDALHGLFKAAVIQYRPELDIEKVATGDVWFGTQAKELKLVDRLTTSDDLLRTLSQSANLYQLTYKTKSVKPLAKLLGQTSN